MAGEEIKTDQKPEEVKKPERADFLKEAREIAETNKKTVEEMRELTQRNEELAAKKIIAGDTDAGVQPEKPKEETDSEYRRRIEKEIAEGKFN